MTQVWERLFLGGLEDAERIAKSNPDRITTVLTLCPEKVGARTRKVNYLHFPIPDERPVSQSVFDSILDSLAENIRWGRVFVHCGAGINRGPIMIASFMDACGYKNIDDALEEIAGLRPILDPSPVLLQSVKEYLR